MRLTKKIKEFSVESPKIIVFDGVCGLCNKFINLLIKQDKKQIFRYTSLQGEYVKDLEIDENLESVIFYDNAKMYYKSTAILKIFKHLGGVWPISQIAYILPKSLRDIIYDFVAKYRYTAFGKMDSCKLPKENHLHLFID